jgi:hypothetical protein
MVAGTAAPRIRAAVITAAVIAAHMDIEEATAIEAMVTAGVAGIGAIRATVMDGVGDLVGDGLIGGDTRMDTATAGALPIPTILITPITPTLIHAPLGTTALTTDLTMGATILHRQVPDRTPTMIPQSHGDPPHQEAQPARTSQRQMMPVQIPPLQFSPSIE